MITYFFLEKNALIFALDTCDFGWDVKHSKCQIEEEMASSLILKVFSMSFFCRQEREL